MRTSLLTQKQLDDVTAMLERGRQSIEIANIFNVHPSNVRDFKRSFDRGVPLTSTKHEDPTLSRELEEEDDAEVEWFYNEEKNEKRIRRAAKLHNFSASFDEHLPIGISFASDQHISLDNTVALKQMRLDAWMVRDTPGMHVICVGDAIDNHIKHVAAMVNSRSTPGDQYRLLNQYLRWIKDKMLVMISGNHDDWTSQLAGVDVSKMLCDNNKIMYAPDEARIKVHLPGHTYDVAARHQGGGNSKKNPTNSIKEWWRNGTAPFDIGAMAHLHELALERVTLHELERWVCRPGSYQTISAHSRQYGYNPTLPACPTFIIYPDKREIVGYAQLPAAARFLTYERDRYAAARKSTASVPRSLRRAPKARRVPSKVAAKKRGRK